MSAAIENEYGPVVRWIRTRLAAMPALAGVPIHERPVPDAVTGTVLTYQFMGHADVRASVSGMAYVMSRVRAQVTVRGAAGEQQIGAILPEATALHQALEGAEGIIVADVTVGETHDWYVVGFRERMVRVYPDLSAGGIVAVEMGGVYEFTIHGI